MKILALAVLVLAAQNAFATDDRPNMLGRSPMPHEHPLYLDALSSDLLATARNLSGLVRYLHPEKFAERNGKYQRLAPEDVAWARGTLIAELAAARWAHA